MNETEASGGSKEGVVRWVLIVGTFLAIVLLTIIWMTGALTQSPDDSQVTASAKREVASQQSDIDDSMVDAVPVENATETATAAPAGSAEDPAGK